MLAAPDPTANPFGRRGDRAEPVGQQRVDPHAGQRRSIGAEDQRPTRHGDGQREGLFDDLTAGPPERLRNAARRRRAVGRTGEAWPHIPEHFEIPTQAPLADLPQHGLVVDLPRPLPGQNAPPRRPAEYL